MLAHVFRFHHRLTQAERKADALCRDTGLQNMLHAHVAFLDYLSREDRGTRNYRTEFSAFYLSHRTWSAVDHPVNA